LGRRVQVPRSCPYRLRENLAWLGRPKQREQATQMGEMVQLGVGSNLGRYELLVPVARGGMAEVWAARLRGTRGFTKLVAIKTLRAGSLDDKRLEEMLLAEADLASQIQHPNVVSTLELSEQDGILFLVMEWADAEPLSQVLRETVEGSGIPLQLAVNMVIQACNGLHCAHELRDADGALLGLVHRDISPQNILVTYLGTVKVVDFGVAKATQRASTMTEDGEVKGKLAYMSPEQVTGGTIDRRTDVFAMGALLYLLTTGQHPFKRANPGETLSELLSKKPITPPREYRADYPEALQRVVLQALEKAVDQRFPTAQALSDALREAVPEAIGQEAAVGEFLKSVSGERGERRRRQIRAAGEALDRGLQGFSVQPEGSSSVSSPSALAGMQFTGSQITGNPFGGPFSGTQSTLSPMHTPPVFARTHLFGGRSAGLWATLVGVAIAAGALIIHVLSSGPLDPAASSPAAADGLAPSPPQASGRADAVDTSPGAKAPTGAAEGAAGATNESDDEDEDDDDAKEHSASTGSTKVRPSARRRRRWTVPAPAASPPQNPAPTSAATAAANGPKSPPPRSNPSPKSQVDSWDPDAFGGRL
jgi:eukaryotic-like serine/threonine-protein kinase